MKKIDLSKNHYWLILKNFIDNPIVSEDDLISVGTSRVVYKKGDMVLKFNLNRFGYIQSKNEFLIYNKMSYKYKPYLTEPLFLSHKVSLFRYIEPLSIDGDIGTIDCRDDLDNMWTDFHDDLVEKLANEDVMTDDLLYSHNCGINTDGKIVFLDYGFTNSLEEEFSSLIEDGEIIYPFDYIYLKYLNSYYKVYNDTIGEIPNMHVISNLIKDKYKIKIENIDNLTTVSMAEYYTNLILTTI